MIINPVNKFSFLNLFNYKFKSAISLIKNLNLALL